LALRIPRAISTADVDISDRLASRPTPQPDYQGEKLAIQDLTSRMANRPGEVLPRLTALALELCDADSAGVSVLTGDKFKWLALIGKLSVFEGTTTPLNNSPCGVCLEKLTPTLMERPERVYSWIADAGISVPEVLLLPLLVNNGEPIGTVWVVAREGHAFHAGHARLMKDLAVFTGIALQMIEAEAALKATLKKHELFASEMSHRVKNFFAVTESLVRMTARHSETKEEMVDNLLRRVVALSDAHTLAQDHHAENDQEPVPLRTVIETVLRPYRSPVLTGPPILLAANATSNLTLVLHELATNAAKHGALSTSNGKVRIEWRADSSGMEMTWKESGGPTVNGPPTRVGFGTKLIRNTLASVNGAVEKQWARDGLHVRISLPRDVLIGYPG
jgi:two-component sensor histidine kinase